MTVRIEILCNGQRIALPGIDGNGVLSTCVTYVKAPAKDGIITLETSGVGHYGDVSGVSAAASWPTHELQIGDEITLRVLRHAEFEMPTKLLPESQKINDDQFGEVTIRGGGWSFSLPFDHPPLASARFYVHAGGSGPTLRQRSVIHEFTKRYKSIWPSVSVALLRCHGGIASVEELLNSMEPEMKVVVGAGDPAVLTLSYRIDGESGRSYIVTIREWDVVEISTAI